LFIVLGSSNNGPILSFSGDPEEGEEAIDLFASAEKVVAEEEQAAAQAAAEEEEEEEPEDDFNAAWEVLDLARAIYDRQASEEDDDEVRLKLADTYIALGDVSLETGLLFLFSQVRFIDIYTLFLQRSSTKQFKITNLDSNLN
jgi:HAT1-interacting factor 1